MTAGTLIVIGMGPGDPELVTVKAARIIGNAAVIAYFAKRGRNGHARTIAGNYIKPGTEELRLDYPFTTELPADDPAYKTALDQFYDESATLLAQRLDAGRDVALLCEGDPFFYGSSMPIFDRLKPDYRIEIIPGVTGMSGGWTRAGAPMLHGDDVMGILPATLSETDMARHLASCDGAVIMKLGRNLPKVRAALGRAGLADRAIYVERATMEGERIIPLQALRETDAPYFSIILVPGRQRRR
jgi:precorrin-2/cobalt-factor-2 C20-methyltransferase